MHVTLSIYECIEVSLLWYDFTIFLEDIGFKLNSYGRCVANKEIGGKNCMVDWCVDDNKLNNMEPFVN